MVRWIRRGDNPGQIQIEDGLGNFAIRNCAKIGDDEEVEAGLWRSTWNVRIKVERGSDDAISGVARPLKLRVLNDSGASCGDAKLKTMIYTGCGVIAPKSLVLRPDKNGLVERAILLRSEDDRKFRILEAKCNNAAFELGALSPTPNYANSLQISYRAPSSAPVAASCA